MKVIVVDTYEEGAENEALFKMDEENPFGR